MTKENLTFQKLVKSYPDTRFIAVCGFSGSGKTVFTKALTRELNGYGITLDKIAVWDFMNDNPKIMKKITGIHFNPQKITANDYLFEIILQNANYSLSFFTESAPYLEHHLCSTIEQIILHKNNLPLSFPHHNDSTQSSKAESFFGTTQSTANNIILDYALFPPQILNTTQYAIEIVVPEKERTARFTSREGSTYHQYQVLTETTTKITGEQRRNDIIIVENDGDLYTLNNAAIKTALLIKDMKV